MEEFMPHQAISRVGEPEDVAVVVALLCSKDARWIPNLLGVSYLRMVEPLRYCSCMYESYRLEALAGYYTSLTILPINSASTFSPFGKDPSRVGKHSRAFAPLKLRILELL